jgi:hypothetical protein
LVNIGKLTVDLKHKKLFVTMDKNNASHYRDVKQGDNHIRPRPSTGRFSDMLFTERTGVGVQKCDGINFLGKAWAKKKGFQPMGTGDYYDYPSLNEIFVGLMKEATLQVTKDSGCPEGSQLLQ